MKTTVHYRNGKFLVIVSLFASFYILFHGRSFDIINALKSPMFYVAFAVSFLITLLMVGMIHYATVRLDRHYDWFRQPFKRTIAQIGYGVLVPLLIDIALLSVYLHFVFATNIIKSRFIRHDFPIIVCFLLLLNAYYLIHYVFIRKAAIENPDDVFNTLTIKHDGMFAKFNPRKEILYFYKEGAKIYLFSKLGKEYSFSGRTLVELAGELQDFDFCKIKRSVLINCDAIQGYSTTSQRDTFRLILKQEYETILPDKNLDHFFISREFLARFRDRFEKI